MPEITEFGTNLTSKCADTTDENTLSTLEEPTKPSRKQGRTTRSKRAVSDTNVSKETSKEPPPHFLANELATLTFTVGGFTCPADDTSLSGMFRWAVFVHEYADMKSDPDWEDLEERARFLNMLYEWCEQQSIPFPLQVK